jgi:hypothetical protein
MFRDGFFAGTEKMKSRAGNFFEHFGFKEQIGNILHNSSLTIVF